MKRSVRRSNDWRKEFRRRRLRGISGRSAKNPGGCRIETLHGSIDQQFEAQLARIEEELIRGNDH